jgi:regulator of sigma E protease
MDGDETRIEGEKIDYSTGTKRAFDYTLRVMQPHSKQKMNTIGILSPARYLIVSPEDLMAGTPASSSGIQPGDRLLWADGEVLFPKISLPLINGSTVFLTVQRNGQTFQTKIPRVHIDDLKMTPYEKAEIDDWRHEAALRGRLQDLYFIPYTLSPEAIHRNRLRFIDETEQTKAFQHCARCAFIP